GLMTTLCAAVGGPAPPGPPSVKLHVAAALQLPPASTEYRVCAETSKPNPMEKTTTVRTRILSKRERLVRCKIEFKLSWSGVAQLLHRHPPNHSDVDRQNLIVPIGPLQSLGNPHL